jgi:sulfate transport system permease protein
MPQVSRRVLPGFGLSLGYTLSYLSLLVLIPLGACFQAIHGDSVRS